MNAELGTPDNPFHRELFYNDPIGAQVFAIGEKIYSLCEELSDNSNQVSKVELNPPDCNNTQEKIAAEMEYFSGHSIEDLHHVNVKAEIQKKSFGDNAMQFQIVVAKLIPISEPTASELIDTANLSNNEPATLSTDNQNIWGEYVFIDCNLYHDRMGGYHYKLSITGTESDTSITREICVLTYKQREDFIMIGIDNYDEWSYNLQIGHRPNTYKLSDEEQQKEAATAVKLLSFVLSQVQTPDLKLLPRMNLTSSLPEQSQIPSYFFDNRHPNNCN